MPDKDPEFYATVDRINASFKEYNEKKEWQDMAEEVLKCGQCGSDDGVSAVPCVGPLCYICLRAVKDKGPVQVGTFLGFPVVLMQDNEEWADVLE